ncbi:Endonuclease [Streptococcus pneumoniae]|nr:Endonuclease [Streptococcus pneumoniae]
MVSKQTFIDRIKKEFPDQLKIKQKVIFLFRLKIGKGSYKIL